MYRLLPLLAFALLPAVVAAPVPPAAGRPTFGANDLLTRADLEKVKFDPRPAGLGGGAERLKARPGGAAKGFEKAAVAVHMPWHTFREGEEVPVYFVFRNGSDRDLSLDARLDLYGPNPMTCNACAINVADHATGEHIPVLSEGYWFRGDKPLVVPANGYYCVRYGVGHTSDGKPLPPGEYEVDWQCAGLHSAGVRFTVTKREDGARPAAVPLRSRVHFYTLTPEDGRERSPARPGPPIFWDSCRLDRVYASDMLAALAVGHGSAYVPDLHTIPDADRLVRVSVEWKPYRDGDLVAVTLSSLDPRKPVRFLERPHLHVHFQTTVFGDLHEPSAEKAGDPKDRANESLVTPLTIEARLPVGWREWSGVLGTPRVAILVTSGRLDLGRDRGKVQAAKDVVRAEDGPIWEGVLRTPFTELLFPPEPARTQY